MIEKMKQIFSLTDKDLKTFARAINWAEGKGHSLGDIRDMISTKAKANTIPPEVIFSRRERKKWLAALPDSIRDEMKIRAKAIRKANLEKTKSGPVRP